MNIRHFAHRKITIKPTIDRNFYGECIKFEPFFVKARVQPYTTNTYNTNGNFVKSAFSVYFKAKKPVPNQINIEFLPEKEGTPVWECSSLEVKNFYNDKDKYCYTKVVC